MNPGGSRIVFVKHASGRRDSQRAAPRVPMARRKKEVCDLEDGQVDLIRGRHGSVTSLRDGVP